MNAEQRGELFHEFHESLFWRIDIQKAKSDALVYSRIIIIIIVFIAIFSETYPLTVNAIACAG